VYIIPPNKDMAILHGTLQLLEPIVNRGIRHPIDFFFRSLSEDQKEKAICIILSGTGTEGTIGLKAVKGECGMVMVQDVTSASYDGMPASAIATGLVDYILPPEKMPEVLLNYIKHPYIKGTNKGALSDLNNPMQKIFVLIRDRTGHDFSLYKQTTINRRIERRMNVHQITELANYVRYLSENTTEIDLLFKELLIGVTSFFRDPQAWEILTKKIIPGIIKNKIHTQSLRIWVTACSTGEEAYSLAIVFKEYLDEIKNDIKIQIFATDLDKDAVEIARAGVYPASIAVDVYDKRLERFFNKTDDSYSVKKEIREMVTFATQNLIKDPPFAMLDMVSCRNLLIYLDPDLQKKILTTLHFSLNKDGVLFLGNSETIGEFTDLYSVIDRKWKIYESKGGSRIRLGDFSCISPVGAITKTKEQIKVQEISVGEHVEKILLLDYAPSCVIINEKNDIIYFHGKTGKYLEPAPGKAVLNILEMAREGLKYELNIAILKATAQKKDVIFKKLNVKTNGSYQSVNFTVKPLLEPEMMKGMLMVIFEDVAEKPSGPVKTKHTKQDINSYVADLERELKSTNENLQTTIEEMQTSNEELQSTNEEFQAANEELQSANEELETSREELQSVNEELMTLNAEQQAKNEEYSKVINDMNNLTNSTEIATIFLDNDIHIREFTPSVAKIFNLIKTDIGRSVKDFSSNLIYENLIDDIKEVLNNLVLREKEVQDKNGNWYLMRILPYRTTDNRIDGVVVTFIDITERKKMEEVVEEAGIYAQNIIDTLREPLLVMDEKLNILSASKNFYYTFRTTPEDTIGKFIYDLGNHQWDIPTLRTLLEDILPKQTKFENFKVKHNFQILGTKIMLLNARQILRDGIGTNKILLAIEDITDPKRAIEDVTEQAEDKKEE
jgi:two-component system CheB/CheR fusion protein